MFVLTLVKIAEYQSLKIKDSSTSFLVSILNIIFHGCCIKVLCVSNKGGGGGSLVDLKKKKKAFQCKK